MSDRKVVSAWLMICPGAGKNRDGTAIKPTKAEIRAEQQTPGKVAELRKRLFNLSVPLLL